jgi:hypothetical protein
MLFLTPKFAQLCDDVILSRPVTKMTKIQWRNIHTEVQKIQFLPKNGANDTGWISGKTDILKLTIRFRRKKSSQGQAIGKAEFSFTNNRYS